MPDFVQFALIIFFLIFTLYDIMNMYLCFYSSLCHYVCINFLISVLGRPAAASEIISESLSDF